MFLRLLGTAAGGGYPQWNCACEQCRRAREHGGETRARSQCSLALSASRKSWILVNATPDIRFQIESFTAFRPGPNVRESALREIILTDAELDHCLGLLVLREGSPLIVYGSEAVLECLNDALPVLRILECYTAVTLREIKPGKTFPLDGGRILAKAFGAGRKPPRYAKSPNHGGDWVLGYSFYDLETNGSTVFAPGIETWGPDLERELENADCALVDGTFWEDDEMIRLGVGRLTAREMGHLPISGRWGTMARLASLNIRRKAYIHINNTNPILDERSPERQILDRSGIEVGWDGLEIEA